MLNRLSGQDLINKNLIHNADIEKLNVDKKNPYAHTDKNLLIDESSISSEALNLYQRDIDIKKFTSLALSDPDNTNHNSLVLENVFGIQDDNFENTLIEGIFSNKLFLKDIFS